MFLFDVIRNYLRGDAVSSCQPSAENGYVTFRVGVTSAVAEDRPMPMPFSLTTAQTGDTRASVGLCVRHGIMLFPPKGRNSFIFLPFEV